MAWFTPRTWVTNETVTAAQMNQHIRDNLNAGFPDAVTAEVGTTTIGDEWQAILRATTGDAVVSASPINTAFYQVGAVVFAWARFELDTTVAESGTFYVNLPVAAIAGVSSSVNSGQAIGTFYVRDATAAGSSRVGAAYLRSTTQVGFRLEGDGTNVSTSNPFVWTTADVLTFSIAYPVA